MKERHIDKDINLIDKKIDSKEFIENIDKDIFN